MQTWGRIAGLFALLEWVQFLFELPAKLLGIKLEVVPFLFQQFGVCAHFKNLTVFDHEDAVGAFDGGEAMGDDEAGPLFCECCHTLLDECFSERVDRACRFVHDENLRICK